MSNHRHAHLVQSLGSCDRCPECQGLLVDAGDEFACSRCGIVKPKESLEPPKGVWSAGISKRDFLGSYMGTVRVTRKERETRGIAGSRSRYEYLKAMSDYAGRDEGVAGACDRMIQRVGEKLLLPAIVQEQASSIAHAVASSGHHGRRTTVATISAYALIHACKVKDITSVSVREIIEAHASMGRNLSSSSIMQLALESPIKASARKPEDYLGRVLAKLSMNGELTKKLEEGGVPLTPYLNSLRSTAMELLRGVDRDALTGRRPCALAASAVYAAELLLSSRESRKRRLTQRAMSVCSDSAEYTIREQCSQIFNPALEEAIARGTHDLPPQVQL